MRKMFSLRSTGLLFPVMLFVLHAPVSFAAGGSLDLERRVEILEKTLENDNREMKVYYDKGFKMKTRDRNFKFQIGGRIQADFAQLEGNDAFDRAFGKPENGAEFRRARVFLTGLLYGRILFRAQYDFAGQTAFNDVYLRFIKIPGGGNFQVGHFKEPFSLEFLTSAKYITFTERSLMNVFGQGRNLGFGIFNHELNQRMTWALGIFRPTGDNSPRIQDNEGFSVTGRLTGLPWYEDKGGRLLHFGAAFSFNEISETGTARLSSKPESNLSLASTLDTGTLRVKTITKYNFESALVWDAFNLQGEVTAAHLDRPEPALDSDLYGFYVEGGWFLTGEHLNYNKSGGIFGRISPRANAFDGEGWGAWQLAARYSRVDLNGGTTRGGEEENVTFGINWYLNPMTRLTFNYANGDMIRGTGGDGGEVNVYQMRFQVEF